jgi:hypothetical protein
VEPRIVDVELLKKKARKLAAGHVLGGGSADVCLSMGDVQGCHVRIAAGYGETSAELTASATDRLIWILDGHVDVNTAGDVVTPLSQGESTVLPAGELARLTFPTLTVYLLVESVGDAG